MTFGNIPTPTLRLQGAGPTPRDVGPQRVGRVLPLSRSACAPCDQTNHQRSDCLWPSSSQLPAICSGSWILVLAACT